MDRIRFRGSGAKVRTIMALILIALPLASILLDISRGEPIGLTIPSIIFIGALFLLWLAHHQGIELNDREITIRGYTSRKILWDEIADVRVKRAIAGTRQAQLLLKKGRPVNLAALCDPWPWKDPDFDDKFSQLQKWWAMHRP